MILATNFENNYIKKIGTIDIFNVIEYCKKNNLFIKVDNHDDSIKINIHQHKFLENICNEYGIDKIRIMCLPPLTTLDYHTDFNNRIHIPLVTNPQCFFIFDNHLFSLPADGSVFLTRTTVLHTAINCSYDYRYHLIGYSTGKYDFEL